MRRLRWFLIQNYWRIDTWLDRLLMAWLKVCRCQLGYVYCPEHNPMPVCPVHERPGCYCIA